MSVTEPVKKVCYLTDPHGRIFLDSRQSKVAPRAKLVLVHHFFVVDNDEFFVVNKNSESPPSLKLRRGKGGSMFTEYELVRGPGHQEGRGLVWRG